jgi:hypothetical protein
MVIGTLSCKLVEWRSDRRLDGYWYIKLQAG